jgi:hypothetical protein
MFVKETLKKIAREFGYEIKRYSNIRRINVLKGLNLPHEILVNCKLLPNRDAALSLLPCWGIMAEVGVAYGDFSRKIIDKL